MKISNLYYYLISFLIIFGIAYIFGFSILHLIDLRLSNIEIKIPNIYQNQNQKGGDLPDIIKPNFDSESMEVDKIPYKAENLKAYEKIFSKYNDGKPCYKPKLNDINNEESNNTYYIDPKNMTSTQKLKFKRYAKLKNMTIKDYYNWLSLFEPNELDNHHHENLMRIRKGEKLTVKDIPKHRGYPKLPNAKENYYYLINKNESDQHRFDNPDQHYRLNTKEANELLEDLKPKIQKKDEIEKME